MGCTFRCRMCTGFFAGVFIILMGVLIVPVIVRIKIADVLALKPGSESWDRWKNVPVPIQFRLYIFHVDNPDEILEGAMPKVREVGPFVYNEKRVKDILKVDESRSRVVYDNKLTYEFDEVASAPLKEDDVFTVLNPPAMLFAAIIDSLKSINPVIHLFNTAMAKMFPYPNPLFVKVKAKDLLFGGIPIICNQTVSLDNIDSRILCEAFKIVHPKTTVLDGMGKNVHSFAFFDYKNGKSDGIYEMDLGMKDITKIGQILSWNNVTMLSLWRGENCNRIVGTDATVFRPFLEEDDIEALYIYHTDVCRSIRLAYDKEIEFKGVKGRRYVTGPDFFSGVQTENENYCFCPQSVKGITHYGGCLKSGVLELSGCQGAPVVASRPHFLNADPLYQGKVEGMNPDSEKHQIFVDLESNTGYPLRAASRVQINAFLKSIPEVELMRKLPNVLIPIIWLEEAMELTDDLIDTINDQCINMLKIVDIVRWIIIGIGILGSLGCCIYYFVRIRREKAKDV